MISPKKIKAIKRIQEELKNLTKNPLTNFGITISLFNEDNIFQWKCTIFGPKDTCYEGGIFWMKISFPEDYPDSKPVINFITPIYHLNVKYFVGGNVPLGNISMSTLNFWRPDYNMSKILPEIFYILGHNNPDYPYDDRNSTRRNEYINNRSLFEEKASYFTKKYANPLKTIKKELTSDWDFTYKENSNIKDIYDEKDKTQLINELKNNKNEINILKNKLKEKENVIENLNDKINNLNKQINELNDKNTLLLNKNKSLNEDLNKSKKVIESLNIKIKEFENRFQSQQNENNKNLNKIKELENKIEHRDKEINELKLQKQNNNRNNVNFSTNNQINNSIPNKDKCVTFISRDQGICFAVPCSGNSTFAEVEEQLYRVYPQYRETNNSFYANGVQILRFKTVNENNAGTGFPVMLIQPVDD